MPTPPLVRPDMLDQAILEPPDLKEFIATIEASFLIASARFYDSLAAFRGVPEETLIQMTDRFDEVAEPLLTNHHTASRNLAWVLRAHVPPHIRRAVYASMDRQDKTRYNLKQTGWNKDELLSIMRAEESYLFDKETH